jgi:hypothetical protein
MAVFTAYQGWKIDIGTAGAPGPGFVLFWASVFLGLFSLAFVVSVVARREKGEWFLMPWKDVSLQRIIGMAVSLLVYPLILRTLGYVIGTFLVVFFIMLFMERWSHPWSSGMSALLIVLVSYAIFNGLLDSRLPKGVFGL